MINRSSRCRFFVAIGVVAGWLCALWAQPSIRADEGKPDPLPPHRVAVQGVYSTGYTVSGQRWPDLVRVVERSRLNAIVIDVKGDDGSLTHVDLTPELPKLVRSLRRKGIYPIARIVTFKDPRLAEQHPDWAVQSASGGIWRDRTGAGWLNPYHPAAWQANIDVALQAVRMGFPEVQFDYVRFPSDGALSEIVYPSRDDRRRGAVIAGFLQAARQQLRAAGALVSADIFGLVVSTEDDMGIGQELEPLAAGSDLLSPMVYPSHYGPGNYGLADPNREPYATVRHGMLDALRRLGPGGAGKLRPWLQDFSLGYPYGPAEVRAQIRAVEEQGGREWLLWNPANIYTEAALDPGRKGREGPEWR